MGKLRVAKKSRGHYAAKKEEDMGEHDSSNLEAVTLHTKEKGFTSRVSGLREKPRGMQEMVH